MMVGSKTTGVGSGSSVKRMPAIACPGTMMITGCRPHCSATAAKAKDKSMHVPKRVVKTSEDERIRWPVFSNDAGGLMYRIDAFCSAS